MPDSARTIQLARRPDGAPKPTDFRLADVPLPDPGPGEVLLRMLWLSLDPYMRGRMSDGPSYASSTALGQPLPCDAVAEVLTSRDPGLAPGDRVLIYDFWRDKAVAKAADCRKLDPDRAPVQAALGVLGMPGLTAWTGLKHIGRPKPGETLVVGAATGAVGSLVGQIARLQGARVVGIAGGAAKCRHAVDTLGFEDCLDRHEGDIAARLATACPNGIDVYFELTGGAIFDAVLPLLTFFARIPVCGSIADYNDRPPPPGPDGVPDLMSEILSRRLIFQGFIVDDFSADIPAFEADMSAWLAQGAIRYREDVNEGLDSMVPAFIGMLEGRNFGKTLVRQT